jgi:hypothetical protein
MNARIQNPHALRAYEMLGKCGPRGKSLADVLEQRGTRVWVTPKIYGGFTLNFINTIFIYPLPPGANEIEFKYWVSLLAHEACHSEQRYWVDSVEQEINAYTAQGVVGDELGINLEYLKNYFSKLDPKSPQDQLTARAALLGLFGATPAGIVYASLPLVQPVKFGAVRPALKQLAAVIRAGRNARKLRAGSS